MSNASNAMSSQMKGLMFMEDVPEQPHDQDLTVISPPSGEKVNNKNAWLEVGV